MSKSVLKKVKGTPTGPIINQRYKWVEFEAEDGSVYRCKVRTSLINAEIEALIAVESTHNHKDMCEAVYKYVEEWNITVVQEQDGVDAYYEVLPPAEGGPQSFDYAPRNLVMAIVGTLINEPFKKIDPNSQAPVETTDEP